MTENKPKTNPVYLVLRYLLPLVLFGFGVFIFWWLVSTRPEQRRFAFEAPPPSVEVIELKPQSYQVILESQGTVRARTESSLAAEVRGRILEVAPNFRDGGFFEQGDLLLRIDDSDYRAEAASAEAALLQAEVKEYQEREQYEQAKLDWERLNPGEDASPLVLREPQMKQAQAAVSSATARVNRAKRDLERTRVTAPFAGRILAQNADVGQYVSPGAMLAQVFAVDVAEVRLPLSERQLAFLDLPEAYRGDSPDTIDGPEVTLSGTVGGRTYEWSGRVVRAESSVDVRTRQLSVVAQVSNPYGRDETDRPPLKIGSFVQARIKAQVVENMFVVPRKLLREDRYVLIVDSENRLHRRDVNVIWGAENEVVINDGLVAGEILCTTLVPYAVDGMQVSTREAGTEPVQVAASGGPPRGGGGGGGFAQRILSALPPDKPLPDELKEKLDKASGDWQATRAVMQEIRAWAEKEGIELPRPRGR